MSYVVKLDDEILSSYDHEETALIDPVVTLEANTAGSFKFSMLPSHPCYDLINLRKSLIDVYQNGELIFSGVPVKTSTDFWNTMTVECEGDLTFLNDSIQRQAKYENQTVAGLLTTFLNIHNSQVDSFKQFELGTVSVSAGGSILRFTNYQSTMEEIGEDLIDNYGGYIRTRHENGHRYLDYLAESSRVSTQKVIIGRNLMDLVQDTDTVDICTVIIPLGAKVGDSEVEGLESRLTIESVNDGNDFIIGTGADFYGYIWKTVTWDDVNTPSILKSKAQSYLENVQWENLVITATAFDLGLADEDVEQFRILDTITVTSAPHGLNRPFVLTKLEIDLNNPANTLITLGKNETKSLSARASELSQEIRNGFETIVTDASENARRILEAATSGNIYFHYNEDGVLYEILILDTDSIETATRIWRWNIGGWGYSADGGNTYTLAATMDGTILADMIRTGSIMSRESDTDPAFYFNLDTGEMRVKQLTILAEKLANLNIGSENLIPESEDWNSEDGAWVGSAVYRPNDDTAILNDEPLTFMIGGYGADDVEPVTFFVAWNADAEVYSNQSLDSLRQWLDVEMSLTRNGDMFEVYGYTLSGQLRPGDRIPITVTFGKSSQTIYIKVIKA